jgi:hypothetical protein
MLATRGDPEVASRLAIARLASGDHLAWAVDIGAARGAGAWRVLVDVLSGEVLQSDDLACHAPSLVYPTDPRSPLEERQLRGLAADSTQLIHRKFQVEN